jgi:putative transposase
MPDHLHLLLTPFESLEKSMQMIKGAFSFKAKRQFEWKFEIWMQGFTHHHIRDAMDWSHHIAYIRQNPVQAHLVDESSKYPYINFLHQDFPQGLKP